MTDSERVLVTTLGNPDDEAALRYALETYPQASVTLLAAIVPLDEQISEGRVLERGDERLAQARDRAESIRESVLEGTDAASPSRVTVRTREGRPVEVVPAYAEEHDMDRIVVPGHEASDVVRWLVGDGIPRTIEERASVPVEVLE
ncbi:universal stress protein [Halovivax sp.]|uniref:universal stress protein n=1 Tax=Halovivax sp. TaxID=1935978 RepID=UPI0025BDEBF9|nr:universal stress protein [Halovivax sp.]